MENKELARLFFNAIEKTLRAENDEAAVKELDRFLVSLYLQVTQHERLQFATFFSRIAFVGHKYQLRKQTLYFLHHFRHRLQSTLLLKENTAWNELYELGLLAACQSVNDIFQEATPPTLLTHLPNKEKWQFKENAISYKNRARVVLVADDPEQHQWIAKDEEDGAKTIRVQYFMVERNAHFNTCVEDIRKHFTFPVTLNLLDVEIAADDVYYPRGFVVEPDYLLDVSAIAECFQQDTFMATLYFLRKFSPRNNSPAILLGNIVNMLLDELMNDQKITYEAILPKLFKLNPIAFTYIDEKALRTLLNDAKTHFQHLKQIIFETFPQREIDTQNCLLEPSFFSNKFGLQGRLDVFHQTPRKTAIVELKSGKPFRANIYGINSSHYIQTLLYDMLIKSALGDHVEAANYILYSSLDKDALKFAPVTKAQQYEAMILRNKLLTIEKEMTQAWTNFINKKSNIFQTTNSYNFSKWTGFHRENLLTYEKVFQGVSDLEQRYFIAFSAFVAREHERAKIGIHGSENTNGLAGLWLHEFEEKVSNFEIINHLRIQSHDTKAENPSILFAKTPQTQALANFRKGDIAVFYPLLNETDTVLNNQIFKCTIAKITETSVQVELRNKQFNNDIFNQNHLWHLEHDVMDSNFNNMYRSLFAFMQQATHKRELILMLRPPEQNQVVSLENQHFLAKLTKNQATLLGKMLGTKEYFLLWGPPGTGKTSVLLQCFAGYVWENTNENILLLAYTNRAVDEICDALDSYSPALENAYLRLGSRLATEEKYHRKLLSVHLEKISTRKELRTLIDGHRIIVATVASMLAQTELLAQKKFHTAVIDEASQIPEPMLVGLLPLFERFILIGDHKQLPAVVIQTEEESRVEGLEKISLKNLRHSLFERMYHHCKANDWHWALGQLNEQGRMHEDIMLFPNIYFYENQLFILPETNKFSARQTAQLPFKIKNNESLLHKTLNSQRVIFINTPVDQDDNPKTNLHEANQVARIVSIYLENLTNIHPHSIGVITPYRAQIAQIRKSFTEQQVDYQHITIDTVERYQGSARDIIIISLCTNYESQLATLIATSAEDSIDRKLNVALTRAREQLVVLGNAAILEKNSTYRAFINAYGRYK